jgi:hypothetical protein
MPTCQVERFLQCLTIVRSIAGVLLELTYKRNLALGTAHILPASVPRNIRHEALGTLGNCVH